MLSIGKHNSKIYADFMKLKLQRKINYCKKHALKQARLQ